MDMNGSCFTDKFVQPDEQMLLSVLGQTYSVYKVIKSVVGEFKCGVQPTWKYYGKKNGWLLKLMSGKRNVLFVIPQSNHFRVSFTFGDRVFDDLMNSDVDEKIKLDFSNAKKYAEGRTIQLKVENQTIIKDVVVLMKLKMNA